MFYSGDNLSPTKNFLLQHYHKKYSFQIILTGFPIVVKMTLRFIVQPHSIFTNSVDLALKLACLEA